MQKAKQAEFTPFDASAWKIGIVVAKFNHDVTSELYGTALKRTRDYKISPQNIKTIYVAGCVEIPLAIQHLAKSGQYKALLAVGCVIKGETPHFDYVCKFVSDGILKLQLDHNLPIGFGVLTCDNHDQAAKRAHLGSEHIDAALQLAKELN